jgi:hypothetical protein
MILMMIFEEIFQYKGLKVEVSRAAEGELMHYKCSIVKAIEVLNEGYDCSTSKRKGNIVEKCRRKGKKELKVVIAKMIRRYPDGYSEKRWIIIHMWN